MKKNKVCKEYAAGLLLTEATSRCTEQIERGRKSDTETANRIGSIFTIEHTVQTPNQFISNTHNENRHKKKPRKLQSLPTWRH